MSNQESPNSNKTVKIIIIEDNNQIRQGLSALINGTTGFQCNLSYASMEEALPHVSPHAADLVLVDIGLPGMSGIDGIRVLKKRFPDLLYLVLSVYDDDDRIFRALCAGASGYLLKKTPPAKLLESLRDAASGGAPMSPEVARRVITLFREMRPPDQADYNLTPHETRLLKLLAEGHNYKTAGAELNVSVNTISFHLKHIYEKLQVHSKSEAVAKAFRDGLIK
ncbi:MAG TPA: response regulator transcription factor [Acidobacteriota bacterium]|nr:response regulator transcription factor [Acidobacteriota bacterium]